MTRMIITRLVATYIAAAIPNLTVGTIIGVEMWKSAAMTGGIAVLGAVQALAEAYRRDGQLTKDEIDQAIG